MESSWEEFKLCIKVQTETLFLKDMKGEYDFTKWLSPPIMQFVFTKELTSLQSVLQMRGYVLEYDGKQTEVLHISRNKLITLQWVSNDICNVMSGFISRYDARPILLPVDLGKIKFKKLPLENVLVTRHETRNCYWLSGAEEDVDKAYSIVQSHHPSLWALPGGVSFKTENEWTNIEISITLEDIVQPCRLIIEPSPYISRPKLHFADIRQPINKALKSGEGQTPPEKVDQLESLIVETINSLVKVTSKLDARAIKVTNRADDTDARRPQSYGNVSCYWEEDSLVVWVTGTRVDVTSGFENIQLFIENGTKLPEPKTKDIIEEVNEEHAHEEKTGDVEEVNISEMKSAEGITIKIYCGDITKLSVECIVNAANEHLAHAGGVARAIAKAAGPDFEREGKEYVKRHGPLSVGTCCVTSAGRLSYKHVIHTVGPTWGDYKNKEKKYCFSDLQEAVEVTFRRADKLKLTSIAIPAISSGIFGVPKESCVEQYCKAVDSFGKQFPDTSLQEIHFVDIDSQMVSLIGSAFEKHFGTKLVTRTVSLPVRRKSHNDRGGERRSRSQSPEDKEEKSVVFDITDTTSLSVKIGDIASYQGSAIVCPQDKKCKSRGQIAKAITEKLENMELEMPSIKTQEEHCFGKVIPVKQGKLSLPWEYIFHAVCPRKSKEESSRQFEQDLKETIRNVFEEAKKHSLQSLVSPLLGAGVSTLDGLDETCAKCLVDVVKDLKKGTCPLKNICVVVASLPIFNTLKSSLIDAGFSIKSASKSDCWKYSHDARPKPRSSYCTTKAGYRTCCPFQRKDSPVKKTKFKTAEKCDICAERVHNPKTLDKCGHVFCTRCIDRHFLYHSECPTCGKKYEMVKRGQPFGVMEISQNPNKLAGYEQSDGTIVIKYTFKEGYQTSLHPSPGNKYAGISHTAYIPNTAKGKLVARLLNVAFSRHLLFRVAPSSTKSTDGIIVWNGVRHKTSIHGGENGNGYPDSSYLDRVLDELYAKGVTPENSRQLTEYQEFSRCFKD
ncbi:uncharacterized protein LOC133171518 [Saccostrea echinata]|uniref:uncharacterized protein LOC133171518 n=1 Tax=Saccostrea echinata TaxID=191078 RepID=UPI002A835ECD|nr:uncharacterized protein LOC133171518 [Saccostrea echinata]